MLPQFGKLFVILGLILVIVGVILIFADRLPFLGKLPGDVIIRGRNHSIYIPIATMLIISILATLALNFFGRGK